MSALLALFLLVHGSIHIGYICSKSWPFEAGDPWLVTGLGASGELVETVGIALGVVTFFAFLLAAASTVGLFPRRAWAWLVTIGSVTSTVMLVAFATPWTLPGLAIDVVLLWAVVAERWTPQTLGHRAA